MFELKTPTKATITSVTPRQENHGDDKVRAVSIGVKITASNTLLEIVAPGLLQALYTKPDDPTPGPRTFEGMELSHLPLLRAPSIESLAIKACYEGWTLHIPYGIDETSALKHGGCKVDKFRISPIEGGSVTMTMRIGTSDVDEAKFGKLTMLLGEERDITLLAPEKLQGTIDGSTDAFAKDHPGAARGQTDLLDSAPPAAAPDAGQAFADAVAGKGNPDGWPFKDGGGPDPQGTQGAAAAAPPAAAKAPEPPPARRSSKAKKVAPE